jgi:hypothetical protein
VLPAISAGPLTNIVSDSHLVDERREGLAQQASAPLLTLAAQDVAERGNGISQISSPRSLGVNHRGPDMMHVDTIVKTA